MHPHCPRSCKVSGLIMIPIRRFPSRFGYCSI
jgi:hypothetical protein